MTGLDLIPVIVEREGATLPDGCTEWGIRTVAPDMRSSRGYRWPMPGGVATADRILTDNTGPCPEREGDGICAALTWGGMASGGRSARTLLLVAWGESDVLGRDGSKVRLSTAHVVVLVDGERLLREAGTRANLTRANLTRADLTRADLSGVNLTRANLTRANLSGADLTWADLARADLTGADLYGACLTGADLSGADLAGANLARADLTGADLSGVNLTRANLTRANLSGADLTWADLARADLTGADLYGAIGLPS